MNHKELFGIYRVMLDYIDRRTEEKVLRFYDEQKSDWKHTKEIVFSMYEGLRNYVEDGIPKLKDYVNYDKEIIKDLPDYKEQFPAMGILKYRDNEYVIYYDEYGSEEFIVVDNREIPVSGMCGETDWYYVLDEIIDNIHE